MVSTHSRPKAAGVAFFAPVAAYADVSTHSRLKAAGLQFQQLQQQRCRFNTQPPEGGWDRTRNARLIADVSTHSRLKAAGKSSLALPRV